MKLADIITQYRKPFEAAYGKKLLPSHRQAINAILKCRKPEAGEIVIQCPCCGKYERFPGPCGNRNCPSCQNHETSVWLNRQQNKLLPVPYFLVTFTVPESLRKLAWHHQRVFYDCLFEASRDAMKTLALDEKYLGGKMGMTGVLHTNTRQLDYHPHIHYIVPAGGFDADKRFWKRTKGEYLFPQKALTKRYRTKLVTLLRKNDLVVPDIFGKDTVTHCEHVGTGAPALKYLSRYLYRGVIDEKRIISNKKGMITFLWRDSKTKKWRKKALTGQDFLWRVIQHTLPGGFRRVRDFGLLHGNNRRFLTFIQLLLRAKPIRTDQPTRPAFECKECNISMIIRAFIKPPLLPRSPPSHNNDALN